jgi:flagellar hook-length control protein FliK
VFSVTSETSANLPFQNAPSRSARADQSPAPDSFSALIDSNAADTAGYDRPDAPDRPSPTQRPDEPSAASDNGQPRDNASSSSAPENTSPQGADRVPAQSVAADGSAETGAISKLKFGFATSGTVKAAIKDAASDIIASLDAVAPSDPAASAQAAASTAAMPAPIAVAIAVPVAATGIVVAPVSDGSATEPLAIAAAAIAATSSTIEATKPAIAPAQVTTDLASKASASGAAAAAAPSAAPLPPATAPVDAADPTVAASPAVQAMASDTVVVPINQPATKTDAIAPAEPQLAAVAAATPVVAAATPVVAAATPVIDVAPQPAPKATAAARPSENAASVKTGIAPGAADPSAASLSPDRTDSSIARQGPAADGKQQTGITVDAAKPHPTSTDAPTATTSPHDHRAAAAQVQSEPSDTGQVANLVQQPHAQSATTVPAAHLSVTAATSAAVPLNGLALQIAVTAQNGKSRFEIRLDPAELGRIDVRIDVDRHGQLTSHLTVEKPETLAMLRQEAPQLQRALDHAGFKTGDGGLQFSLRDQSGQNGGNEAGRNAQRLIISEEDSVPAAFAGRTYGRLPGSGSGVDISV